MSFAKETMFTDSSFYLSFSNFTLDEGLFVTVFSILDCAVLCLNTKDCHSFFYIYNERSCLVTSAGYLDSIGLTPQAGVNYYSLLSGFGMQCLTTADCSCKNCICSLGSCQCDVGYSYQPSTGSCVMRCSEYGKDFAYYVEHGVASCNSKSMYSATGTACMEACRDETSFVCINTEFKASQKLCNLCDTAWFDLPRYKRETFLVGWVLYYRHCAN